MTEQEFRDWLEGPFGAEPIEKVGDEWRYEIVRRVDGQTTRSSIFVKRPLANEVEREDFKRFFEASHGYPDRGESDSEDK